MLNVDLLNEALARIEAEPHRWNQTAWATNDDLYAGSIKPELLEQKPEELCGTQMCLAGHTMIATGNFALAWRKYEDNDQYRAYDKYMWFFNLLEGEWVPTAEGTAAKVLGLDPNDEVDARLIGDLFLTTGYSNTYDQFQDYKKHVDRALNRYYRRKIEALEARLKVAEEAVKSYREDYARAEMDDAVATVTPDPWANAASQNYDDTPPF